MNRNAWQLFCNDPEVLASEAQKPLENTSDPEALAHAAELLTFTGQFQMAKRLWITGNQQYRQSEKARASLLRIKQYQHHSNPWLGLCMADEKPWLEEIHKSFVCEKNSIALNLGGGLGDKLEVIGLIQALHDSWKQRIELIVPNYAEKAITPLLRQHQHQHQIRWMTRPSSQDATKTNHLELSQLVFRALLCRVHPKLRPHPIAAKTEEKNKPPTLVCCWRAQFYPREKLWAHLRSLDMATIVRLYRELMPIAQQRGIQVVDITRYRKHEAQELLNRHPSGLSLTADTLNSFVDTTKHFGGNTLVASIDTSLVHLACWCGLKPVMLAHHWPDGRWFNNSWQSIDIFEQETLFDWEPPIQRLIQRLRNHQLD